MKKLDRKQERKFFITVIVLLIATCLAVVSDIQSEANENLELYKNMHKDFLDKELESQDNLQLYENMYADFLDKEEELKKFEDWINFLENAPDNIVIATVHSETKK